MTSPEFEARQRKFKLKELRDGIDIHGIDQVPDDVLLSGHMDMLRWLAQHPIPLPRAETLRCRLLGHKWETARFTMSFAATRTCLRCSLHMVTPA